MRDRTAHRLLLTVAAAAFAFGAQAQGPPPAGPPPGAWKPVAMTFPDNRITLIEAVRLTLANDPTIRLQEQRTLSQSGAAQIQTGQFDPAILGNASWSFTQNHLLLSQLTSERKRRSDLDTDLARATSAANQAEPDLQRSITQLQLLQANPNTYQVSTDGFVSGQRAASLLGTQLQVNQLNKQIAAETNPLKRNLFIDIRDNLILTSLVGNREELRTNRDDQNELTAERARLGDVPEKEQQQTVAVDLKLLVPTRTGLTFGLFGNGGWEWDRFAGKRRQSDFGGPGVEDLWHYEIGFSLDAQLLRGRGEDATGAFERAANIDYESSRFVLQHAVATAVLNTEIAYWNLVAAQEFLETSRYSTSLHTRRVEVTKGLIEGDEIPRAELPRELASQATDEALVLSAERQVGEARVALARAMGLAVLDQTNTPYAADPFPPIPAGAVASLAPAELIAIAHERRYDRLAAFRLIESGGVLMRQAITALRPRLDFGGQISANTQAETSLAKTAFGWAAPSFQVSFDFEKPIGNNVARGLVVQTQADLAQRNISAADLERNIDASIVQILYSLRATEAQLGRVSESVRLYGETIESENEKFRSGQTALIDAILTQDLQTSARFTFTTAKQQWATLLTRLRFETGTLVASTNDGVGTVRYEDLVSLPTAPRGK